MVSEILSNASTSVLNTEKGNVELERANDYSKTYGLYWAMFFGILGFILLFYDFLKSK